MKRLIETNDAVLLSYVEALLRAARIDPVVLDRHMSLAEGSIGVLPRRLMVVEEDWSRAAEVLAGAGLAEWISRDGA